MESTTKTQLLSVSQAQLANDQPSTSKSSGDCFRVPFKKGRGSGGKQAKKGKKGGGLNQSSSLSEGGGGGRGAGRGRGRGRSGGAIKHHLGFDSVSHLEIQDGCLRNEIQLQETLY